MKRILLAFLLLLALAVPAWGLDGTWTNATEDDKWDTAGNWDGGVPGAPNDEAIFDGSEEGRGLPSVNLPDLNALLVDLIFAADYSTVEAGSLSSTGLLTAEVVARDGNVILDQTALWGQASNGTLTLKAGVEFDNTFTLFAGGIITPAGAGVVIDGGVSTGENGGTLDWGNGNLTVIGYMKANECIITHINTTGATLTCDTADNPNLDLGTTDANSIAITTSAAVTIGNSFACGTFTMGADVVGGSKTITVGAGGFEMTAGTLTGELTVDLSAAAGAYTQTAGTIDTAPVLDVTTGSGGFTCVACTVTGAVNITAAVNTNLAKWDLTVPNALTRLTINSGITVTQSGVLEFVRLDSPSATAVLAGGAYATKLFPGTATDWGFSGSITGTGLFTIFPTATPIVFSGAINAASRPFTIGSTDRTVTVGGLACSALTVASGGAGTNTLIINGNSSGTTVTLGSAVDKFGVLTLGPNAVHKWTEATAAGGGASNALTFGGEVHLGGNYTGTGITPTWTAASTSTAIIATANITFNAAEVAGANGGYGCDLFTNGKTVTWQNINNSTAANKVRIWGGGTVSGNNTNITAHSGVPSGLSMTGMGL